MGELVFIYIRFVLKDQGVKGGDGNQSRPIGTVDKEI
jgi:hypothetical protein